MNKKMLLVHLSFPCVIAKTVFLCLMPDCRGRTKLSPYEGDIRDVDFLRKVCHGATIVFHLVSIIDVYDSVEESEIYGVNVKGDF